MILDVAEFISASVAGSPMLLMYSFELSHTTCNFFNYDTSLLK